MEPKDDKVKRRQGRPRKQTDETVERILQLLRAGNYRTVAWKAAGISHETGLRWMREDHEFHEAVLKAEAQAQAFHLANILKAAQDGTWQASAWYLERRAPEQWGRQDRRPEGTEKLEITLRWEDEEAKDA